MKGGQVGAICWKVWAKGEVRTLSGPPMPPRPLRPPEAAPDTARDFTEDDMTELKSEAEFFRSAAEVVEGFLKDQMGMLTQLSKMNTFI